MELSFYDDEIININSYLSKKWNLTSTIDSDGDGIVDASDPFPTDPSKSISFPQALRDNASDNYTAINGLALWLDASNIDGEMNSSLSDGDAVSEWKDLSGNGSDVIEHPGTDTPIYQKTGFNETESTVYFDANDILHAADNYPHPFRMNRMTIYVVGNNNIDESSNVWRGSFISKYGEITSSGEYAGWKIRRWGSSNQLTFTLEGNTGSESILDEVDGIFTAVYDGANKEFWANGQLEAKIPHTKNVGYNDTHLGIGGYFTESNTPDGHMKGEISEIIVFNRALTSDERAEVNLYLSNKWNLTSTVDSDGDGLMDADDPEPKISSLNPVFHIDYKASEVNGNRHLALPNSTVFDTPYPYAKPNWVDDTVNSNSVKVMNFSSGNQWMLVDDNGDRLSMPGTYDGWTLSM